jgi:NADPH-dependent curcumin reductase CurA
MLQALHAGAAGSFILQFAKQAGAKVATSVGNDKKAAVARSLGADTVINYRTADVSKVLSEAYPEGLDWVVDGVGGELQDQLIEWMKPGARMFQIGYISEYPHTGE